MNALGQAVADAMFAIMVVAFLAGAVVALLVVAAVHWLV